MRPRSSSDTLTFPFVSIDSTTARSPVTMRRLDRLVLPDISYLNHPVLWP